jgi:PDZ domain-containing protein
MQRRGITVLVGAVVVLLLTLGVMVAPVPYVVLQPGPTWDTLGDSNDGEPVLEFDGEAELSDSAGELHLTTVSVQPSVNLLDAIYAWFDGDDAVVPEELVYPPEQSREEVEQRNAEQFTRSQSDAEVAALSYLGYPSRVLVVTVVADGPAAQAGLLSAGDVLTSVNGTEITEADQLRELVTAQPAGATLTIEYVRDGEPGTAEVTTASLGNGDDTPRLGVEVAEEVDAPFELTIGLERIGGPSAGLMFALGIIDKLDPEDLTGGEIIAGTGTIDGAGNVGAIGGVPQKLVAAGELGAVAFLVPAANCAEAVANAPAGLMLVRVETLVDAVDALAALRADRDPAAC